MVSHHPQATTNQRARIMARCLCRYVTDGCIYPTSHDARGHEIKKDPNHVYIQISDISLVAGDVAMATTTLRLVFCVFFGSNHILPRILCDDGVNMDFLVSCRNHKSCHPCVLVATS